MCSTKVKMKETEKNVWGNSNRETASGFTIYNMEIVNKRLVFICLYSVFTVYVLVWMRIMYEHK